MHPNKDKLIITQDTFPKEIQEKEGFEGNGFYFFVKEGESWKRIKRLPLAYGWGASITPDKKFVYVRNSDIYYVPLSQLGIDW